MRNQLQIALHRSIGEKKLSKTVKAKPVEGTHGKSIFRVLSTPCGWQSSKKVVILITKFSLEVHLKPRYFKLLGKIGKIVRNSR